MERESPHSPDESTQENGELCLPCNIGFTTDDSFEDIEMMVQPEASASSSSAGHPASASFQLENLTPEQMAEDTRITNEVIESLLAVNTNLFGESSGIQSQPSSSADVASRIQPVSLGVDDMIFVSGMADSHIAENQPEYHEQSSEEKPASEVPEDLMKIISLEASLDAVVKRTEESAESQVAVPSTSNQTRRTDESAYDFDESIDGAVDIQVEPYVSKRSSDIAAGKSSHVEDDNQTMEGYQSAEDKNKTVEELSLAEEYIEPPVEESQAQELTEEESQSQLGSNDEQREYLQAESDNKTLDVTKTPEIEDTVSCKKEDDPSTSDESQNTSKKRKIGDVETDVTSGEHSTKRVCGLPTTRESRKTKGRTKKDSQVGEKETPMETRSSSRITEKLVKDDTPSTADQPASTEDPAATDSGLDSAESGVTAGGTTREAETEGGTTRESEAEGGTTRESEAEGGTTREAEADGGTTRESEAEGGTTRESETAGGKDPAGSSSEAEKRKRRQPTPTPAKRRSLRSHRSPDRLIYHRKDQF